MRVVTWNLQHGGGSRIERFVEALLEHAPDVAVLTEFRHNKAGTFLRDSLRDVGFIFQFAGHDFPQSNLVFIASRLPFEAVMYPNQPSDPELGDFTNRVLLARFEHLNVFGLYFPSEQFKHPVFDFLIDLPRRYLAEESILIGDFNTGRHNKDEAGATFIASEKFEKLLEQGWIDSWRSRNLDVREFSWFSRGYKNGFRLDHVFASPSADHRITDVRYSHSERESGITDHSMMVVDIED